jgi:hypothetical protein
MGGIYLRQARNFRARAIWPLEIAVWLTAFFIVVDAMPAVGLEPDFPVAIKGKWVGSFDQYSHDTRASFAMVMTVDEVSGSEFAGTIDWPENNNNRTKIKGNFEGGTLKWTETEYIRGDDVVLGGLYIGKFTDTVVISGTWMDPKHTIHPRGPNYGTSGGSFVLHKQ